jgi:osmotically-inducible protein OsmY
MISKILKLLPATSLLLVLMIATMTTRSANAPQTDCSTVTDADIVKAVQQKIKEDPQLEAQWKQFNITSKDKVVLLRGWVKGEEAVKTMGKYARQTACVAKVNNRLMSVKADGCGRLQQRCGDICIGSGEQCNQ